MKARGGCTQAAPTDSPDEDGRGHPPATHTVHLHGIDLPGPDRTHVHVRSGWLAWARVPCVARKIVAIGTIGHCERVAWAQQDVCSSKSRGKLGPPGSQFSI